MKSGLPSKTVLVYSGGNLGMAVEDVTIRVRTAFGVVDMPLELALRHIDSFAEPGRSRLWAQLEQQFDLTGGDNTFAKPCSWGVSFAGNVVPFNTRSEAEHFMRDYNRDVANLSGGTYRAVMVRIPALKEATH